MAARIAGDLALQHQYATIDAPAPAPLRRPISVNAIANSLNLPFETVRRRVRRMIAIGLCDVTPEGLLLVDRVYASPEHRGELETVYELMRNLYIRLQAADCIALLGTPPSADCYPTSAAPPVRIVWRASCEYFLRMMELISPSSSLTQAFILMAIVRANTAGFSDALRGGDTTEVESFVPDTIRRPVRMSELAVQLGLPHETTRRNLIPLLADGRVRRVGHGYIVPAEVLAQPRMAEVWTANFRNFGRMLGDLAHTGVLARWDAEQGMLAPAAARSAL
jgi:hypothetical protein